MRIPFEKEPVCNNLLNATRGPFAAEGHTAFAWLCSLGLKIWEEDYALDQSIHI
jgi:hypothetical protein